MSQRTALLITTALTVFVMVMLTGIAWQVFQKTSSDTMALQSTAPAQPNAGQATASQSAVDPFSQAQLVERENNFQQLIQEANARLEQAYKQQQELAKQLQEQRATAPAPAAVPQQPMYKVSAEQALAIALATVPESVALKPAELVSFHDLPTYEVTLDKGVVYVDANTGQVVYNSAAVIVIRKSGGGDGNNAPAVNNPPPPAQRTGGKKEDHNDDHESQNEHEGD